ncbi:hypothetical protein AABB24_035624 [Solanum stoloniferum]|uniref:Uncharacterized protein n=1 Tax=Solanum stoloniferum TaxID=62892 RepID=A0ABD2R8B7_9SOLN
MESVHGRQERKLVMLNRYNQPNGPTNAVVTELGSFLGILARNAMLYRLNIHNWKNMDTKKKDLWDYTQEMSERNTKNRKKWMNPHTASKTSFAVIPNNLEKEKESPDELSAKELFVATRSRKPGRVYKDSNKDTISKIAEMEKMQSQQNEDDNQSFDAFIAIMGHEHLGCLRLYGRGVTKSTLKRKALSEPYLSANDERMEKKKKELEERMHQRMAEKLEQQQVTIHQEVTDDIIGRLNRMYPGLQLNAAKLASVGAQSPQEAMQPLNRPSSSKNHQGGEDNQGDDESSDEDLIT